MMKKQFKIFKKHGFTLIELLAVIIVLAIITLIAIPITTKIIEKAKDNAAKRSVENYIKTIETEVLAERTIGNTLNDGEYYGNDEGNLCSSIACENPTVIAMKGIKPSGGVITLENGKVVRAIDLYINNKFYSYIDGEITSNTTPQTAGAYDENNKLIANWDTLVSNGTITVRNNKITGSNSTKMSGIKLLIIPEGITSIGNNAFQYRRGLNSITIPNSVTSIENYAFYECTSLTSITIPNSVTRIGNYAFYKCTSLTSITIPSSVITIESNPFTNCTNLESITVESGNAVYEDRNSNAIIRKSDNTLISGCKNTVIPNSVTSIGYGAFYNCTSLTSITIPDSVTNIGARAFAGTGLTSINIPNSVASIGSYAFYECTSLKSVTIPNSVTSIEDWAFSWCTSLSSITIPNSVISIGYHAFSSSGLTSITIPSSVTNIDSSAFIGCSNLESITVESGNEVYEDRNSNAIIKKSDNTLMLGCRNTVIPNTVTNIGGHAFYYSELTSITIPNSVTSIGTYAFANSKLTSITIPNSVTSIGDEAFRECRDLESVVFEENSQFVHIPGGAFMGCTSLTSITIPNSVTSIGNWAFDGTGLTSITIPRGVTSIGEMAFYECTDLGSVTFEETSGWKLYNTLYSTTGTSVNVSDVETNANRLSSNVSYCSKIWKRS